MATLYYYSETIEDKSIYECLSDRVERQPDAWLWLEPRPCFKNNDFIHTDHVLMQLKDLPDQAIDLDEARIFLPDSYIHLVTDKSALRVFHASEHKTNKAIEEKEVEILLNKNADNQLPSVLLLDNFDKQRFGLNNSTFPAKRCDLVQYWSYDTLFAWRLIFKQEHLL